LGGGAGLKRGRILGSGHYHTIVRLKKPLPGIDREAMKAGRGGRKVPSFFNRAGSEERGERIGRGGG